jgi:selenocysteine lyase/cysteine desulfurase
VVAAPPTASEGPADLSSWEGVRASFQLRLDYIHMASMLLASHPTPVRTALANYRRELDENPVAAVHHLGERDQAVLDAAGKYIGAPPESIALTDSTTMGLGMVYTGLDVKPGEELICTLNCHYSTRESMRYSALRSGAKRREVRLYQEGGRATEAEIVGRFQAELRPETRYVAVTYVHSSTGVKLPITSLADIVRKVNAERDEASKIRLCVDGVHGFGIENIEVPKLGCDYFIAGTHKWLFGPRGTGIVWASERGWSSVAPTIPPFAWGAFTAWMKGDEPAPPRGPLFSPGGFHSFEHRWALKEAFEMHLKMGKARVEQRIHALATQTKEGLAKMKHVTLRTPMSAALSSGIVCFEVAGMKPDAVVDRLHDEHKIIASTTPYATSYARLSPGLINTPEEIDRTLAAIRAMA